MLLRSLLDLLLACSNKPVLIYYALLAGSSAAVFRWAHCCRRMQRQKADPLLSDDQVVFKKGVCASMLGGRASVEPSKSRAVFIGHSGFSSKQTSHRAQPCIKTSSRNSQLVPAFYSPGPSVLTLRFRLNLSNKLRGTTASMFLFTCKYIFGFLQLVFGLVVWRSRVFLFALYKKHGFKPPIPTTN